MIVTMIAIAMAVTIVVIVIVIEVEQIKEIADRGHVMRYIIIRIAIMTLDRVGQIVAAPIAERLVELPVPLDELHERGMLVIDVADVTAGREGRHGDHRDARARAEEIDRLDEARIIVAAAFVDRDEDRGLSPELFVGLHLIDDVLREGLEEIPFRRRWMTVQ